MSPEQAISTLDRQLATNGSDMVLRRLTLAAGGTQIPFDVTVKGKQRGLRPEELVDGVTQQDTKVVISPTQIDAANWPGAATATTTVDRRIPVKNDRMIIAGKIRNVEAGVGRYMNGQLVRIEIMVKG